MQTRRNSAPRPVTRFPAFVLWHERRIYFLCSDADFQDFQWIAECPISQAAPARAAGLTTPANGKDRVTDMTWKSLAAYGNAEKLNFLRPSAEEK